MQFDFERAVQEALNEPGKIHAAYSSFWNYSLSNQMLAMWQLGKAEPISTFPGWQKNGRFVKKGSKAIALLMPVTKREKDEATGEEKTKTFFIERRNWFGLSQTDGDEYKAEPIPDFDLDRALAALKITKKDFNEVNGNAQGYAIPIQRSIAVSPIAFDPVKTQIHEIMHVLLHGKEEQMVDGEQPGRSVKEVEAELGAYLVKAALGITQGLEFSRGYIQSWLKSAEPEKIRYPAVFGAVNDVLKAGRPAIEPEPTRPGQKLEIAGQGAEL